MLWLETLFSTDPADHRAAESGVKAFFEAAELEAPGQIVWLDSPAEACYASLLLCAGHERLLEQVVAALEKVPGTRSELARVRDKLQRATGATSWNEVAGVMGAPLAGMGAPPGHDIQGKITLTRIAFWKDPSVAMGNIAQDPLFVLENRFWGAIAQTLQTQGNMLLSSVSRKYHLAWMAMDEAAAETRVAPPLLTAAWKIARASGPWWPFRNGAIVTERPIEVHRNAEWMLERGDGPAIKYRDGWQVFAWNGYWIREKWITTPESISARELKEADARFRAYMSTRVRSGTERKQQLTSKPSSLFKMTLPPDPEARIKFLRERNGGRLPLYERYLSGERREVWKELVGLGAAVRVDPYAADAMAVAYETMLRVEANVGTVVDRLQRIGYQFATERGEWDQRRQQIESALAMSPPVSDVSLRSPHVRKVMDMMEMVRATLRTQLDTAKNRPRDTSIRAHIPPHRNIAKQLRQLEQRLGTLPLSLRAFYEVVGSVNFIGSHPSLSPHGGSISPDPLVVFSAEDALADADGREDDEEEGQIVIAPDDLHKANVSGGEPYAVSVPDERADAELLNERHELLFVEYLRLAFRFGGFPGYEGYDRDIPEEIEILRQGLVEF